MPTSLTTNGAVKRKQRALVAWDTTLPVYEDRMGADLRWALTKSSKFFEGQGAVQETLRKITKRLSELGIAHAVVGGMALFSHGLRRYTEDVDILVTAEGLKELHDRLEGLGYPPPFSRSKNLRDTETGVKIEFSITGGFPGDGLPKPVAFPDPAGVAVEKDGIAYVDLPTLMNLKIASGMTNPERMKDLADALELIKILNLASDFADQLNPYVRDKFLELWRFARPKAKRYIAVWPSSVPDVKTIEEFIAVTDHDAAKLQSMRADGVMIDPTHTAINEVYLVTADPDVARKYDMHDESEYLDS